MTLQQLAYFSAACEHGSFSAAATALHLAQPSLSEQIRNLEAELGVALFQRVGRGIVPTEAGRTLREHAATTLAAADDARAAVAAVREVRAGTATFGTWGTARYYPGTEIVAEFRRRHPGVRVRMVGQNSAEVVKAVHTGELEAGMVALPIDDTGLDVRPIMADEVVYVSTVASRVRRPMTIERLAEAPLILPDASWGAADPTRRQLNELAQRAGTRIEPQIDVEDVEAAIELAGQGLGDTIIARGMLRGLGDRVPASIGWVPFADPGIHDTFAFVSRRGGALSPSTREFLAIAEDRLKAFEAELRHSPPRRRRPGGAAA
jgi:DNA-binding transcriptional LysR family regulator